MDNPGLPRLFFPGPIKKYGRNPGGKRPLYIGRGRISYVNHFFGGHSSDLQRLLKQFFMRLVCPCHVSADDPRRIQSFFRHAFFNILHAIIADNIDRQRTSCEEFCRVVKCRGMNPEATAQIVQLTLLLTSLTFPFLNFLR